ncbi:hypothetical protein BC835DRAFT_1379466 [Cytidiella melzeri]|nr:hypothetical protein BC835DRAFT_1379466 [Cytidiella melzeri]
MADSPQDAVAIFHCSFHPTRGNVIDWSLKAAEDINLTNIEFCCLPSGLHTIGEDVVYFSHNDQPGLCIFRRRRTEEHGHRGFRLSSLGVLLAGPIPPQTTQPWLHVPSLKSLVQTIYSSLEDRDVLEPTDQDWDPARAWFEEHRSSMSASASQDADLTLPLPTLLLPRILSASSLGPSLLTISRFLLARRRVLILAKPPVEGACMMCWAIGDLCSTVDNNSNSRASAGPELERPKVMGMVTLHDIDQLQRPASGNGWIACTTDSVFVDKTRCWDLLVDVTSCDFSLLTSTPLRAPVGEGRPRMYVPKGSLDSGSHAELKSGKKEFARFAWSDVKFWTDLTRLAPVTATSTSPSSPSSAIGGRAYMHTRTQSPSTSAEIRPPPGPSSFLASQTWLDVGKIYEDACILCAGLWYSSSQDEGRIRLEGNESLATSPTYERSKWMSVDSIRRRSLSGDTIPGPSQSSTRIERAFRRVSGGSAAAWTTWTGKGGVIEEQTEVSSLAGADAGEDEESNRFAAATISRAFAAYHLRLLKRLSLLIEESSPSARSQEVRTVVLAPKDLASLDLGPLSAMDARWVEWLAEAHSNTIVHAEGTRHGAGAGTRGRTVVKVRRARWRDVLGVVFGYG